MAKKFGDLFGNMDDVFSGAKISNFDLDDVLSRTRTFTEEVSKKKCGGFGAFPQKSGVSGYKGQAE